MKLSDLEFEVNQHKRLYIYGTGVVAGGAAEAIQYLYDVVPEGYLVSDTIERWHAINPQEILILIATPEQYHNEIIHTLVQYGYGEIDRVCLTSHMEYLLMGEYLKQKSGFRLIEDCRKKKSKTNVDIYIAEASSGKDIVLNNRYESKAFIHKVLCDQVECPLDNSIYGELSAMWWMHKYEQHDVMGLYHYRRDLLLDEIDISVLKDEEADVILPLPFVCEPDTSGQYGRYLHVKDQQVIWDILKKRHPEFYEKAEMILQDKYLYNYNILIARKEVFNAYFEWLFTLLEEISKECEKENRPERKPRYIGRIGEVLTSLYFTVNEQNYKIIHGEKRWKV